MPDGKFRATISRILARFEKRIENFREVLDADKRVKKESLRNEKTY